MHTQNDEAQIIARYFAGRTGRFLDVGAHDGETFSNSRGLVLAGWSGVLVEPAPGPFLSMLDRYGGNPSITLINAAVADVPGLVTFHESGGDMVGSINDAHAERWSSAVKFRDYTLCAITPAQLLSRVGTAFDFISLDVEGGSADLFHAMLAAGATADCWCIEHDGRADEILRAAAMLGMDELGRNAENIIVGKR